jgi:hypothetical protein
MGARRIAYRILVGKRGGKRPLGKPRCRWVDIKMHFKKGWNGIDWIDLSRDRDQCSSLMNMVMKLQVP